MVGIGIIGVGIGIWLCFYFMKSGVVKKAVKEGAQAMTKSEMVGKENI